MTTETTNLTAEQADLLAVLAKHRGFLKYTVQGLTDEQARQRTTTSELTLGNLIKHVTFCEKQWVTFILDGPDAMKMPETPEEFQAWQDGWTMRPDETLHGLLERYDEVARRTEEVVRSLPSLDIAHPLPEAPWFEKNERWSARRVLMHVLAETTQHAGHADIIRESLDGQKTMG